MIHSVQNSAELIIYRFLPFMALILLTACTVEGKDYSPFNFLAFPDKFHNANNRIRTPNKKIETRYAWWENYNDPALNLLIDKMLNKNLDLKIAGEQILQARESINIAQSNLFPKLNLSSSTSRQATPANAGGFATQAQSDTFYNNSYNLGLNTQWQIDLFGSIRNNINSRTANYLSVQANRDAVIHSLIIEMVQSRVTLGNLQERQRIINQTIKSRQKTLETIERRYKLGITSVDALQVRLARENLESAKAQLPPITAAITEIEYAIDLLIGEMPSTNKYNDDIQIGLLPPPQKLSLPPPMAILDSRPDLRSHRYRLMAANHDINVALADLFPSVSISAGYGFQSQNIGDLIDVDAIAWNLVGNIMQPLFEGGRIRANIRLQESEAREMANEYAKAILQAVNEVENALQTEENLHLQLSAINNTLEEAKHAYSLARTRYEKGLIPLTDMLDIERRMLAQELQILEVQQDIWQARLQLYLATGGNWLAKDGTYDPALPPIDNEIIDRV